MNKQYHFGVVATIDDNGFWSFEVTFLGGDGPFIEMDEEVYDLDSYEWECAHMTADDGTVERTNFVLLEEAVSIVENRLDKYEPITNVQEARP